jgi:hypothetical protein
MPGTWPLSPRRLAVLVVLALAAGACVGPSGTDAERTAVLDRLAAAGAG